MGKRITAAQSTQPAVSHSPPAAAADSNSSVSSSAAAEEPGGLAGAAAASSPPPSSAPSARAQFASIARAFSPSLQDGVKRGEAAALSSFTALLLSLSALAERAELPAEMEVAVDALHGRMDRLRRAVVQLRGQALSTSDELQRRREDAAGRVRELQREDEEQRRRAAQQERQSRQTAAEQARRGRSKRRRTVTAAQRRRRQEMEEEREEAAAAEAEASSAAAKRARLSAADAPPPSSSSPRYYSIAGSGSRRKAAVTTPPSASRSAAVQTRSRAERLPLSAATGRPALPAAEAPRAVKRQEQRTRTAGGSGRTATYSRSGISRLRAAGAELQAGEDRQWAEAQAGSSSSVFDF